MHAYADVCITDIRRDESICIMLMSKIWMNTARKLEIRTTFRHFSYNNIAFWCFRYRSDPIRSGPYISINSKSKPNQISGWSNMRHIWAGMCWECTLGTAKNKHSPKLFDFDTYRTKSSNQNYSRPVRNYVMLRTKFYRRNKANRNSTPHMLCIQFSIISEFMSSALSVCGMIIVRSGLNSVSASI